MQRTSSPPRPMRGKIIVVAFLAVGLALLMLLAVYAIVVLAGLRPYFAAYWYAGLAAGAAVAIGMPVLSLRAMAKDHHGRRRWPLLLLVVYLGAVGRPGNADAMEEVGASYSEMEGPGPGGPGDGDDLNQAVVEPCCACAVTGCPRAATGLPGDAR